MKKINQITASILLIFALFITGCAKDPIAGPAGPAGPDGKDGTNGSANVKSYAIFVSPSDWQYSSVYKQWYFNYPIEAAHQSAVLGYVMSGNGHQVLPYIDNSYNAEYTFASQLYETSPFIQFQFVNHVSATTKPTYTEYFTLVIIPPSTMRIANAKKINFKNYEEVKSYYNLPDLGKLN